VKLLLKKNYFHLFFLTLLFFHYLFSLIFVGQVIIDPHDTLELHSVYDHIISKIYKGNVDSVNYFLSGKLNWYYLENIFYPINILHYFLNDKFFYFTNDILIKLFAYFSFYLLAKSFCIPRFTCALGGLLYSIIIFTKIPFGFALPFLPYILYLLLNKDSLNKKHYFALFLIGLHTSIMRDGLALIFLLPLSFLLRNKRKNLNIYIQVLSIILIIPMLSSTHLIIGSILSDPIHRTVLVIRTDIVTSFLDAFNFFLIGFRSTDPLLFFNVPLNILYTLLFALSLFSNEKKIKLLFFFIISILIIQSIVGSNLINIFFIGIFDIFKGFNFRRIDRVLPLAFTLLFIFFIFKLNNKNLKRLLYFVSIISILSIQLKTPLSQIVKYILQKNMYVDKFDEAKNKILENNYTSGFKIIFNKNNYTNNEIDFNDSVSKTFDNYFKFDDYAFIRNIVKKSRVMSVGLDPMIAVMNDIKVIDGYHTVYPLHYKIKFRKIIEKELETNSVLKNYYDDWGNRVYALYNDEHNIMLNFQAAKTLGADYIISKFPIKNNELKIVCYKCNNSNRLFLYKIL
jgi:hypothetical protein